MTGLESALEALERDADAAVKTLTGALREAKKVKAAAAAGQLRDVQSGLEATSRLADASAHAARELRQSWSFDPHEHFANGGFTAEFLTLAAQEGLAAFESDERLLSYPAIVQISASDTTVLIDRTRERRVRPSVLVKTLKALQSRPPRFRAEAYPGIPCSRLRPGRRPCRRPPRRRPSSWWTCTRCSPCCQERAASTARPSSPATSTCWTRAVSPKPATGGSCGCRPRPSPAGPGCW